MMVSPKQFMKAIRFNKNFNEMCAWVKDIKGEYFGSAEVGFNYTESFSKKTYHLHYGCTELEVSRYNWVVFFPLTRGFQVYTNAEFEDNFKKEKSIIHRVEVVEKKDMTVYNYHKGKKIIPLLTIKEKDGEVSYSTKKFTEKERLEFPFTDKVSISQGGVIEPKGIENLQTYHSYMYKEEQP